MRATSVVCRVQKQRVRGAINACMVYGQRDNRDENWVAAIPIVCPSLRTLPITGLPPLLLSSFVLLSWSAGKVTSDSELQ